MDFDPAVPFGNAFQFDDDVALLAAAKERRALLEPNLLLGFFAHQKEAACWRRRARPLGHFAQALRRLALGEVCRPTMAQILCERFGAWIPVFRAFTQALHADLFEELGHVGTYF